MKLNSEMYCLWRTAWGNLHGRFYSESNEITYGRWADFRPFNLALVRWYPVVLYPQSFRFNSQLRAKKMNETRQKLFPDCRRFVFTKTRDALK